VLPHGFSLRFFSMWADAVGGMDRTLARRRLLASRHPHAVYAAGKYWRRRRDDATIRSVMYPPRRPAPSTSASELEADREVIAGMAEQSMLALPPPRQR
jgi:hypothetical protein